MNTVRRFSVLIGDITVLAGSFFITLLIRNRGSLPDDLFATYAVPFLILYILWIVILYVFDLYDTHRIKPDFLSLRQILLALITQAVAGFLMFYFIPYFGITPKTTMFLNVVVFGIIFIGWRTLFYQLIAYRFQKTLVIIGSSPESLILIKEIKKNPHIGYKYIGNFETLSEMKEQGITSDIIVLGRTFDAKELMLLTDMKSDTMRIFEAYQKMFFKIPVTLMSDQTAIKMIEYKESPLYSLLRRVIEIIFAFVVLAITLPFTLITALAILIEDGGPIFYTHVRTGKRKKNFNIIKFRSMINNAETNGAQWAQVNDPRITRVGRIIRKLHIDEIPQMWNILRGDIALVGPRAERPELVEKLEAEIPYYFLRSTIKPGFTGWAQIKFRYARTVLESKDKFEYDLFYIRNRNFFLDIGIILKTIQIIFTH